MLNIACMNNCQKDKGTSFSDIFDLNKTERAMVFSSRLVHTLLSQKVWQYRCTVHKSLYTGTVEPGHIYIVVDK